MINKNPEQGFHTSETENTEEINEHCLSGIKYLEDLLSSEDFLNDYQTASANKEEKELEKIEKLIQAEANQLLKYKKIIAEEKAFEALQTEKPGEFANVNAAKKALRQDWGKLVNQKQQELEQTNETVQINGHNYPYNEAEEMILKELNENHQTEKEDAQEAINQAKNTAKKEMSDLKLSLENNKNNPDFLKALDVWGMSPDSKGERGKEGKGFHAGIAHFFEYRRGKDKLGRFNTAPTIENFVAFSNFLQSIIQNPNKETNPIIKNAVYITDELGQSRLMCHTEQEGSEMFVNAFQKPNDRLRIITAVSPYKAEQFQKDVEKELNPSTTVKLNELGEIRKQKSFDDYSWDVSR